VELSAAQVVEAFAARFRQEDGVRDHNQRRAMEHCRAWTKEPVRRTFQVQMVALTLRRLLQCRLDQIWGTESWWSTPQGYAQTRHASIRDRCRLFWRPRAACSQLLVALEERDKLRWALDQQGNDLTRAA
jgi:hypothetical protein